MKEVIVVHKTHLDLGFTDLAENVRKRYLNDFIPKAIRVAAQLNTGGEKRFVWTTGSWLIKEALSSGSAQLRSQTLNALKNGDIAAHALPFTTHSELLDRDTFEYGLSLIDEIDAVTGMKTTAAKMTDVPGHTAAIVPILAAHGIIMHTQIVLCKGVNDGEILEETLRELAAMRPQVASVAIVPVGLTGHREGLKKLDQIDKETARTVIAQVEAFDKKEGGSFCYCSDEFYLKADLPLPSFESYGDFSQIENGVGLVRAFGQEVDESLKGLEICDKKAEIAFITGQSFKGELAKCLEKVHKYFPCCTFRIVDIYNDFFGRSITVAGLITATDIIAQAKDMPAYTVIPSTMLREFTHTFLDGISVEELENKLNTKIIISAGGADLVRAAKEATGQCR